MKLKKKLRRRARREKQVKRAADPTSRPAHKAGLGAPVESLALPSPDVEVLIKKIAELCTEQGWWLWAQQAARRGRASQVRPRLFTRLRGQVRT